MSVICLAIIAPAIFTGFFLAMGIMARSDRRELEEIDRRVQRAIAALEEKEQSL